MRSKSRLLPGCFLALLLCLGCAGPAAAGLLVFKQGRDLHEGLQQDAAGYANALHYIVGVVDATNGIESREGFCFALKGEGIRGAQVADVVRDFLVQNPQMWERAGSTVVAAALEQAWPCR